MPIEYGDEPLTIVEIDQPFCLLDYGINPCTAALGTTETKKCYNTRFTCQDPENYTPEDKTLKFYFSQEGIQTYGHVIPSLEKVSTTPLRVNIGAMDPDMSPFGERETVTLTFTDHKHSDLEVDKYRTERPDAHGQVEIQGFDPYERGTFWGKWLARNPFYEGYPVRIKEGRMGDPEVSLRVRHYLIDKIDGPSNGRVTVKCKDLFSLIEERKAEAPVANTGELAANITAGAGSLVLSPFGVGDEEYSNSGYIAIGSEVMNFTRIADVMTLVTRGDLNTSASAHETEDKVQEVLEYDAQRVDHIIIDLLTHYTEINPGNIPSTEWATEAINNLPTLYTGYIPKPTPVIDLIAELAEQVGFTLWPDVETNLIELRAVGVNITPIFTVDDDGWIIADTINIERDPDQRVSRVQVFYGQINPLEDLDDEKNYRSKVETRDIGAEDATQYGTKSIRKIFSRWIPQFGRATATTVSNLVLKLFRDPPFRASFELDIQRAGQLVIGLPFALKTRALVNDLGEEAMNTLLPISISRGETSLSIEAQKLNLSQSDPVVQERIINIDEDINNVNMRELHDSLFSPAGEGDEVTFIITSGVIVGSDNINTPAMQTGDWPTGVILNLELEPNSFICGRGGDGGPGGRRDFGFSYPNAKNGGTALLVEFLLNIVNNGVLGGGGGGGGGGGAGSAIQQTGGGGGGGAGTRALIASKQPGGGIGGTAILGSTAGGNGTIETAGPGGIAVPPQVGSRPGGNGGAGGVLGQNGNNGFNGGIPGGFQGGIKGLAGNAVDGDSLVTYTVLGDIRGPRVN